MDDYLYTDRDLLSDIQESEIESDYTSEMTETDYNCPECGELLKLLSTFNAVDDYTDTLFCTCGYREEE